MNRPFQRLAVGFGDHVARPDTGLRRRAAGDDFGDRDPPNLGFLGQHKQNGKNQQGKQRVHQSARGQHQDTGGGFLGSQTLRHGRVGFAGQPDEPAQRNQVDRIQHIRQLKGAAVHRPHFALMPEQVVHRAVEMAGLLAFDPFAVQLHFDRDQPPILVLDRADLYPLARQQGLGAVQPDETGIGVQLYFRAPGVDAEQPRRKAHPELQRLDAKGARRGEVAQFVNHHQNQQQRRKSANGE